MEIHSVLPEERAKDPKGETLPWGYRYADSSRNPRAPPEESGPFGRNRSLRVTGSRSSRTRTGTTPVRQQENPTVAGFGRLFAKDQAKEEAEQNTRIPPTTTASEDAPRLAEPAAVATECLLYGYAGKSSEWKVLSKFEKIVTPSIICEDYPREDPNLFLSSTSAYSYSRSAIVVHKDLSQDALKKSRIYQGGEHWIKVTFDSYQAAERACFYSPIEIDGHLVYCEMWEGRGPFSDQPLLKGLSNDDRQRNTQHKLRSLTTSQSTNFLSGNQSAMEGFERALNTLPRNLAMPSAQYGQPPISLDDSSIISSNTASSATATDYTPTPSGPGGPSSALRSRSTPNLPMQPTSPGPTPMSQTRIPGVKRIVLRPIAEALPPQPSLTRRILRTSRVQGILRWVPIVSWFLPSPSSTTTITTTTTTASGIQLTSKETVTENGIIGTGPALKEDGTWDPERNSWYWRFWYGVDGWLGTDFCGLSDD